MKEKKEKGEKKQKPSKRKSVEERKKDGVVSGIPESQGGSRQGNVGHQGKSGGSQGRR